MSRKLRVLFIDIETSPNLAYVWSIWNQNVGINQLEGVTEMICFAAKWLGEKKTLFFSEHLHGRDAMVAAAHALLDEADVVVHYNGSKFDRPHINREILLAGLTPPAPYAQLDLCSAVKRQFRFTSNKLQHVAEQLGIGSKVETGGFDLWRRCLAGDAKAWKKMREYNIQDTLLLEDLYLKLLPWLPGHPSRQIIEDAAGCPTCGSEHLQRRGYAYTQVSKYQRFQCRGCGCYFRATKRETGAEIRGVTP